MAWLGAPQKEVHSGTSNSHSLRELPQVGVPLPSVSGTCVCPDQLLPPSFDESSPSYLQPPFPVSHIVCPLSLLLFGIPLVPYIKLSQTYLLFWPLMWQFQAGLNQSVWPDLTGPSPWPLTLPSGLLTQTFFVARELPAGFAAWRAGQLILWRQLLTMGVEGLQTLQKSFLNAP